MVMNQFFPQQQQLPPYNAPLRAADPAPMPANIFQNMPAYNTIPSTSNAQYMAAQQRVNTVVGNWMNQMGGAAVPAQYAASYAPTVLSHISDQSTYTKCSGAPPPPPPPLKEEVSVDEVFKYVLDAVDDADPDLRLKAVRNFVIMYGRYRKEVLADADKVMKVVRGAITGVKDLVNAARKEPADLDRIRDHFQCYIWTLKIALPVVVQSKDSTTQSLFAGALVCYIELLGNEGVQHAIRPLSTLLENVPTSSDACKYVASPTLLNILLTSQGNLRIDGSICFVAFVGLSQNKQYCVENEEQCQPNMCLTSRLMLRAEQHITMVLQQQMPKELQKMSVLTVREVFRTMDAVMGNTTVQRFNQCQGFQRLTRRLIELLPLYPIYRSAIRKGIQVLCHVSSDRATLQRQELNVSIKLCVELIKVMLKEQPENPVKMAEVLKHAVGVIRNLLCADAGDVAIDFCVQGDAEVVPVLFELTRRVHNDGFAVERAHVLGRHMLDILEAALTAFCQLNRGARTASRGAALLEATVAAGAAADGPRALADFLRFALQRAPGSLYAALDYRAAERVARCWARSLQLGPAAPPFRTANMFAVFRFIGDRLLDPDVTEGLTNALRQCVAVVGLYMQRVESADKSQFTGAALGINLAQQMESLCAARADLLLDLMLAAVQHEPASTIAMALPNPADMDRALVEFGRRYQSSQPIGQKVQKLRDLICCSVPNEEFSFY